MEQADFIGFTGHFPQGFHYQPEFLSLQEESALLEVISSLRFKEAEYRQWHAKRRIVSYGGRYDFTHRELNEAPPIPGFLHPLRARIANWAGVSPMEIHHAVMAEYRPGTQLGWHRDVPNFERVMGVSLGGHSRMRFRPYPPGRENVLRKSSSSHRAPPIASAGQPGGTGSTPFRPQKSFASRLRSGACETRGPLLDARSGRPV